MQLVAHPDWYTFPTGQLEEKTSRRVQDCLYSSEQIIRHSREDAVTIVETIMYERPNECVCAASKSSERRIRLSWRRWNEQTLTRLLTWAVMESSESITTPRFLTCEDGVMSAPDISRGDFGQCCRDERDPSQMTSVFVGLSRNRFEAIQPLRAETDTFGQGLLPAEKCLHSTVNANIKHTQNNLNLMMSNFMWKLRTF